MIHLVDFCHFVKGDNIYDLLFVFLGPVVHSIINLTAH